MKINLNTPIMVASGTYGYGDEVKGLVDVNNIGAIITKSVTRYPREGNPPPRISEERFGMLNSIGLANLGVENFLIEKIPVINSLETDVIINVAGSKIDDYVETLEMLESSQGNHIGYEINISCPNVKEGGIEFGVSPKITEELTAHLRKITDKALIMKLSPNVTSIEDIGLAAENGGADYVSAINTVVGMGIDSKTRKVKLNTVFGGYSGSAIKPIALANVHKLFKALSIPIIGIGGISSTQDVLEFFLAGASMVQVGTSNYKSPNLAAIIDTELNQYCEQKGLDSYKDLIGKVCYI
tara:strand:- start:131 stop:1024 length:894 start_codon:yes stop_codon:yes gene_type:complete